MSEKDNNPQVTTNEIPNSPHPLEEFKRIAKQIKNDITDQKFAKHMDDNDPLRSLRQDFCYPKMKDLLGADLSLVDPNEDCVYFCGNSLGLCPKMTKQYMDVQLEKWAKTGAQGYHQDVPWVNCHEHLDTDMAKIVGGRPGEVAIMNGLTVNLHHLLISFYRPTQKRHKILCETNAFPSDYYTFQSQISLHGYDPETSLLCVEPKVGEVTLRTEDILAKIEEEGDSIAVICFSGVHYYTGQMFDMLSITRAGHAKGCYVGFDLAHAAGNVPLYLHDWDIDFACWCTYKYMNSSPGSLACIFLHNKHKQNDFPKLIGWWGHHPDTKFNMDNKLDLCTGAYGYRVSAPPGLLYPPIKASLEAMTDTDFPSEKNLQAPSLVAISCRQIFNKTSLEEIRAKSKLLTAYLEYRIVEKYGQTNGIAEKTLEPKDGDLEHVHIFTPSDPEQRGAQLSLSFSVNISYVFKELEKRGVICDERKPSVIRVSPAPLYCSFQDVHRFMEYLDQALKAAAITAALDKE